MGLPSLLPAAHEARSIAKQLKSGCLGKLFHQMAQWLEPHPPTHLTTTLSFPTTRSVSRKTLNLVLLEAQYVKYDVHLSTCLLIHDCRVTRLVVRHRIFKGVCVCTLIHSKADFFSKCDLLEIVQSAAIAAVRRSKVRLIWSTQAGSWEHVFAQQSFPGDCCFPKTKP